MSFFDGCNDVDPLSVDVGMLFFSKASGPYSFAKKTEDRDRQRPRDVWSGARKRH